ncbi:MAG: heat-inducible transcription repressor HrcA [Dehalococcoidia bacterium]|nr:MAG: heat-inducible transcription repressor HrcA [Dehalococcoidia bacterium]
MISPRTGTILKSIVEEHIVRGTPVSSQCLTADYALGVSPATVRNEMARLEQEGFILRPYPSAGSIPSDKGYRYYVETLTDIELPLAERRLISHLFHQVERDMEEWLRLAATVTARLAQNVALVTLPKPINCRFQHLEVILLQESLALMVLVLRGAKLKQQLITFDQVTTQSELSAVANKLNVDYADLTRPQILARTTQLPALEQGITDCLAKMMQAVDEQEYEEPYLDGLHFIINQPEFAHSQRLLSLMELIEQRNLLKTILPSRLAGQGVQIIIGKENKAEAVHNLSVVIHQYGLPMEAVGTIGVVGPTRMHYGRAISTINYLALVLSELIAELYGRDSLTRPESN